MNKANILAISSAGNVTRCPGGCVHVNIPGVSLHLTELQFVGLSRLVQDASANLMDETFNILLEDPEDP